jgi:hypothetical protein
VIGFCRRKDELKYILNREKYDCLKSKKEYRELAYALKSSIYLF